MKCHRKLIFRFPYTVYGKRADGLNKKRLKIDLNQFKSELKKERQLDKISLTLYKQYLCCNNQFAVEICFTLGTCEQRYR